MADQRPKNIPARKKTALDVAKLAMEAKDRLPGAKKPPKLQLILSGYSPHFKVYYNNDAQDAVTAKLEQESFYALLELIEELASNGSSEGIGTVGAKLMNKHNYDSHGNKMAQPGVVSSVVVGLDESSDNELFIAVVDPEKPPIKFHFRCNFWYNLVDMKNQPLQPGQVSKLIARGRAKMWRDIYAQCFVNSYVPPEPGSPGRPGQGNQNRGGQRQQQGGGGGGWNGGGDQGLKDSDLDSMFDNDVKF